jgi:hypothetical protein
LVNVRRWLPGPEASSSAPASRQGGGPELAAGDPLPASRPVAAPPRRSILGAVLVAAGIALVVNLVRFHGERNQWVPAIFNTGFGGGGSPLSATWLVLVFGFWLGRTLALNGNRPAAVGRALLLHLLGAGVLVGVFAATFRAVEDWPTRGAVLSAGAAACGTFAWIAWGRAYLVNLAAALLASIPVIPIQYLAIEGGMDVHFAKSWPGSLPEDAMFLLTMTQLVMWPFGYAALAGGLFAVLGAATVRRS